VITHDKTANRLFLYNHDGGKDRKGVFRMKKRFAISGLLVSLLVLVLAFVSCSNGSTDDEVDAKWRGHYAADDGSYADVGASSLSYDVVGPPAASGTVDKLSMGSGGQVKKGATVIGTWVYVRSEGENFGFFMDIPSGSDAGIYCGLGEDGVDDVVAVVEGNGGSFTPAIPSVDLGGGDWFSGKKQ
jgi:hypothetical protein